MALVIIVWAVYLFGVDRFLFHGFRISDFTTTLVIVLALFFFLVFWSLHHLSRPTKQMKQNAAAFWAHINRDRDPQ